MADYIDRQAAIDAICRDGVRLERGGALIITISTAKQWAVDLLSKLPSAQPEIVRCRDCKHFNSDLVECDHESGLKCIKDDHDYCCHADRRQDGLLYQQTSGD